MIRKAFLLLVFVALPVFGQIPGPVPVRSIDPADEGFSDLMPLVQAIGKARVVQLGEATHGDGATFLAKARLIRFLHQVMGFDVIAWEAGIADVRWMDDALRAGLPSAEASKRALYNAWQNREVMATLDYVRASQGTDRPIAIVGFDCRVSRPDVRADLYPKRVFDFFDRLDPALISKKEREDFTAMSVGLVPADYYNKPGLREYNRELPKRLVETIDRRRDELLIRYPPREIDYIRQTLVSFMAMDRALGPGDKPIFEGYTRDTAMAENLLWWLDGPLKDRKVVVWAHNYHVMNDFVFQASGEMRKSNAGPMGRFLKEALGPGLYTIGFTAFSGASLDLETGKAVAVQPGALETALHGVGRPWLFLDSTRLPVDHPLRKPLSASFYFNEPGQTADWSRVYDGVFFLETQKPATPLP
jgi:erythromycin esterase